MRTTERGSLARWAGWMAVIVLAVLVAWTLVASARGARVAAIGDVELIGPPSPDPRPDCGRGFRWGGEGKCWGRGDGAAFTRWLRGHGSSPVTFRRNHPGLAAIFGPRWGRVNVEQRIGRRIDRLLARYGSPMRPAIGHVRAARAAGVSPFAIIAISGVESTFGRAACGRNSTGLGACGRAWTTIQLCGQQWSIRSIRSWAAGTRMTGELIRCLWPGAVTVHDLHGYCYRCPTWGGKVAWIMRQMGSGPGVRWRAATRAVR